MDRLIDFIFRRPVMLIIYIALLMFSCPEFSESNNRQASNKIMQKSISEVNGNINPERLKVSATEVQASGTINQEVAIPGDSDWRELGIKDNLNILMTNLPLQDKITLIANETADQDFGNLLNSNKPLRYFLPKGTNCEFERKLCEDTIKTKCCEYLCLDIPNPCAIAMLTNIYIKYPDSEVAPTALLMIARSLWGGDFGSGYMSFKDESDNLVLPIIKRYYPDTWQSVMATYILSLAKLKSGYSPEKIQLLDIAIRDFEALNVLNNKYYKLYMRGENGIALMYFDRSGIYFNNGYEKGRESISRTGWLSSESIDLCKKGMEKFAIGHNKYPDSEDMRYNKKGYPMHVAWANRCFDMINRTGDFKDK